MPFPVYGGWRGVDSPPSRATRFAVILCIMAHQVVVDSMQNALDLFKGPPSTQQQATLPVRQQLKDACERVRVNASKGGESAFYDLLLKAT